MGVDTRDGEDFLSHDELEVGETYFVEFQDCCVQGSFVARLKVKDLENFETEWENGVKLDGWAPCYYSAPRNYHLGTGE